MAPPRPPLRVPPALNVSLVLVLAAAVFWAVYRLGYRSSTFLEYVQDSLAVLSAAAGVAFGLSLAVWFVLWTLHMLRSRRPGSHPTHEEFWKRVYREFVDKVLRRVAPAPLSTGVLVAAIAAVLALPLAQATPDYFPPTGRLAATPVLAPGSGQPPGRHIYAVAPARGELLVFDEQAVQMPHESIPLGNRISPAEPNCIAVAPRTGLILVTDARAGKLYVIDRQRKVEAVAVGQQPRCVALTPDERKAYISNEQPAPHGTISVYDLGRRAVVKTITGVNCPEGLAVTPDGSRLYVATQCGAADDPLIVIDTASDRQVAAIPGFAVGLGVAVSPDGRNVLVWRHNPRPGTGSPNLLTVVSRADHRPVREIGFQDPVTAVTFTPDGRFLFVASGARVLIYETVGFRAIREIPASARVLGVAVSGMGGMYVLKEDGGLFMTGLTGLLQATPR